MSTSTLERREMSVWEAAEFLNTLIDDSDPDTDLSQLAHLLQTSEQIRSDGHPRGGSSSQDLIHDLGKVLCLCTANHNGPWWATHSRLGAPFSDKIVFPAVFFDDNPDKQDAGLQTPLGIYEEGCGLDKVMLSWGHDEYIYHVTKDLHAARGAVHACDTTRFTRGTARASTTSLTNEQDRGMLKWVLEVQSLRPLHQECTRRPMSRHCGRITRISSQSFSRPNSAGEQQGSKGCGVAVKVWRAGPHDPHFAGYFCCFNEQKFYEAHDVLEALWLQNRTRPGRRFLQGPNPVRRRFCPSQKTAPASGMETVSAVLHLSGQVPIAAPRARCHQPPALGQALGRSRPSPRPRGRSFS